MHPVDIENDAIRMKVWPSIGGKVSSIIDKADNYELLFSYPAEIPDAPNYDAPYAEHWFSGWDECFPAVGPSLYPRHPYNQIPVPDHGELWGIPTTAAVPTKNGITTVWHGLRFGYRLTRKLYLDDRAIVAEYSLNNLAPFEFCFVWAMHALFSMAQPVEFIYSGHPAFRLSHNAIGTDINANFTWPTEIAGEDLSKPASLSAKKGWKSFSYQQIESAWEVRYPTRNRSMRIEYSSVDALAAYWGIWISTGGWGGHTNFAIEPTTGRYDQIDRSVKDGSAGTVAPFGRREWAVRLTLS
jgi:hypothetical protein